MEADGQSKKKITNSKNVIVRLIMMVLACGCW